MQVANIIPRTEAEGPGVRWALWVQGCPMRCPGCCNPAYLPFRGGSERSVESLAEEALEANVEGVSFLGGEPFAQAKELGALAKVLRASGLSVMVYTGYTLAELSGISHAQDLLSYTDLLVDGRYDASKRTTTRRWIGSENQVLHFLTDRYSPQDPCFSAPNHFEIRIRDGQIVMNGWPVVGNKKLIVA